MRKNYQFHGFRLNGGAIVAYEVTLRCFNNWPRFGEEALWNQQKVLRLGSVGGPWCPQVKILGPNMNGSIQDVDQSFGQFWSISSAIPEWEWYVSKMFDPLGWSWVSKSNPNNPMSSREKIWKKIHRAILTLTRTFWQTCYYILTLFYLLTFIMTYLVYICNIYIYWIRINIYIYYYIYIYTYDLTGIYSDIFSGGDICFWHIFWQKHLTPIVLCHTFWQTLTCIVEKCLA